MSDSAYNDDDFEPCRVKYYGNKDFGFLTREDGTEAFFHANQVDPAIIQKISPGLDVEAIFRDGPKGPVARVVRAR